MGAIAGGIPLSESGPSTPDSILNLSAQLQAFLLGLLSKGSEWEDWYVISARLQSPAKFLYQGAYMLLVF